MNKKEFLEEIEQYKYYINNRCIVGATFSHIIWNLYNPNDKIVKGDGAVFITKTKMIQMMKYGIYKK